MKRERYPAGERIGRTATGGRVGPPTAGVPGTLYDFVRRYLVQRGGSCSRPDLLAVIKASPVMSARLNATRGFNALLSNMHHSGDILFEGDQIHASDRTLRRLT